MHFADKSKCTPLVFWIAVRLWRVQPAYQRCGVPTAMGRNRATSASVAPALLKESATIRCTTVMTLEIKLHRTAERFSFAGRVLDMQICASAPFFKQNRSSVEVVSSMIYIRSGSGCAIRLASFRKTANHAWCVVVQFTAQEPD